MNKKLEETGARIRTYRQALGMSLQQFADKLHKSKATVSKYENGLISIDLETLYEIADVLNTPLFKLICPSENKEAVNIRGQLQSRQYLYSYARKGSQLTKSVLDHYFTEKACLDVTFFYDIPSFEQLNRCRGLYEGTMTKSGPILNYQFVNRGNSTEHTFLCCLESLDNNGYNMGLLSSISYTTMTPNAIKVILSPHRLPEDDHLKSLLLFDKDDIQRLKKDNMLTIDRR